MEKEALRWNYIKSAALSAAFLALGICIVIIGPTLPTLAYNLNTTEGSLSYIITSRGAGYLLGSVLSAFLLKRIDSYLLIAICMILTAIGSFIIPFAQDSILLAVLTSSIGCSMGVLDTGGNVLCLEIWGVKSEPWMQALHFLFAVGATIGPLIAKPFINEAVMETSFNTSSLVNNISDFAAKDSRTLCWESYFSHLPCVAGTFAIASLFCLLVAISFFVIYFTNTTNTSLRVNTSKEEGIKFRVQLMAVLFVFFFLYVGTEVAFSSYLYTFAIKSEKRYSKNEGTLLNSLYWGAFATGRFLCIFISKYVSPKGMLVLDLLGIAFATVISALFPTYAESAEVILWIAVALYGWSMASMYPSGISWGERYITINGRAAAVIVVGGAMGEMTLPAVVGQLIELNPMNIMYFCSASTGLCILNFLLMLKLAERKGSRHKITGEDEKNIDTENQVVCQQQELITNDDNSTNEEI